MLPIFALKNEKRLRTCITSKQNKAAIIVGKGILNEQNRLVEAVWPITYARKHVVNSVGRNDLP